jgi:uncharacterized protein YgiB involved in biofilm formation
MSVRLCNTDGDNLARSCQAGNNTAAALQAAGNSRYAAEKTQTPKGGIAKCAKRVQAGLPMQSLNQRTPGAKFVKKLFAATARDWIGL